MGSLLLFLNIFSLLRRFLLKGRFRFTAKFRGRLSFIFKYNR